jgi:hypothetical protein
VRQPPTPAFQKAASSDNLLLHESYRVSETAKTLKTERPNEPANPDSRMKLRDYLFLAKTASTNTASKKRKILDTLQEQKNITPKVKEDMHASKAELKREKYGMKNSDMFEILKREMEAELAEGIREIEDIRNALNLQLKEQNVPSNGEMVMMYNLRALVKEKLRGTLAEMKEMVLMQSEAREERIEMEIVLEEDEMGRDLVFNNAIFNKNCADFELKLKDRVSFGK